MNQPKLIHKSSFVCYCILFLAINLFYKKHLEFFRLLFQAFFVDVFQRNFFFILASLVAVQIPLVCTNLPGFAMVCLVIGNIVRNATQSIALMFLSQIIVLFISLRFFFFAVEKVRPLFEHTSWFVSINKTYSLRPLLYLFLIQIIQIPICFKIIILIALNCNQTLILFTTQAVLLLKTSTYLIIGQHLSSISAFYAGIFQENSVVVKCMNFIAFELILTGLIIVFLVSQFYMDYFEMRESLKKKSAEVRSVNSKTFLKEKASEKNIVVSVQSSLSN